MSAAPETTPAIEGVSYFLHYQECYDEVVRLFRSARRQIYMGAWVIDFDYALQPGLSFLQLVEETCRRGVQVDILISDNFFYPYVDPRPLPKGCRIEHVANFGHRMPEFTRAFIDRFIAVNPEIPYNGCLNGYHQKYLAIDAEILMVSGVDINGQRCGDLRRGQTNQDGYVWHEIGVTLPCSEEAWRFAEQNFERPGEGFCEGPNCLGSFARGANEEAALVRLVQESERSLYVENQHFVVMPHTRHGVGEALIARIVRAARAKEPFEALVVTNRTQLDSSSKMSRFFSRWQTYNTVFYLVDRLLGEGLEMAQIAAHLCVVSLDGGEAPAFVHSKLLIQDSATALVSSSNISDRSLLAGYSDLEFGVLIEDAPQTVSALQRELLEVHLRREFAGETDFHVFFSRARAGEGHFCTLFPADLGTATTRLVSQRLFSGVVALHGGVFF